MLFISGRQVINTQALARVVWLWQLKLLTIAFIYVVNCCNNGDVKAAESALSGLGEPAAPESLAHPEQIFPNQSEPQTIGGTQLGKTSLPELQPTNSKFNSSIQKPNDIELTPPVVLHENISQDVVAKPFTIKSAVEFAQLNYPGILRGHAQVNAAKKNVTVQKLNEYLPESLIQYQEIMASHNKLSQVFFGSPVFPAMTGPGFPNVNMEPNFFSAAGFSLDWAPIDFGLHKARIQMAKSIYGETQSQFDATDLNVGVAAASAFLDAAIASEQVKSAQQNVSSFSQFSDVVHASVNAALRPGADASLADAQLANARNDLIRADLARQITVAELANTLGLGGRLVDIDDKGLVNLEEKGQIQTAAPVFENVPILKASHAAILTAISQKKVLDKEYYPVFHFMGGVSTRGAGLNNAGRTQSANVYGLAPVVPNYQVAVIINWNFLDIFRLHQEKKVQEQRIIQQQQDYQLILQNLKTQDLQSRARIKAAILLAANMPVQVEAARVATQQAEARYKAGLGTVAQVAEALEMLAQSRVQEAVVRAGVWRALLTVAAVHGDLKPFLAEADRMQRGF